MPAHRVLLGLLLLLILGCDRNVAPFDPDEQPRRPDLSRIFPQTDEEPEAGPMAGVMPAAPRGGAAAGAPIRGRVSLAPELAEAQPPGGVLFLIARRAGSVAGPPLAVRNIPAPRFPVDFEIGPGDVMVPSFRFEGEISLSARLDSDGNATTRLPGDLQGRAAHNVTPGSEGVEIVLDERL
jgi:cytochrome c-type biogenesis protein CcmH